VNLSFTSNVMYDKERMSAKSISDTTSLFMQFYIPSFQYTKKKKETLQLIDLT